MFLLPLGNNIKEFQSNKTLESKLMSKILYIWIDDKILLIERKENRIAKPNMRFFFLWSWRVLSAQSKDVGRIFDNILPWNWNIHYSCAKADDYVNSQFQQNQIVEYEPMHRKIRKMNGKIQGLYAGNKQNYKSSVAIVVELEGTDLIPFHPLVHAISIYYLVHMTAGCFDI